jgi:hypothetical protein
MSTHPEPPWFEPAQETLLELCLIMPARLSDMLAVLSRLMRPLVAALRGSNELVQLALRTLEYWVDSLNPEFLEPAMAEVTRDLMTALWSHLRPMPYAYAPRVRLTRVVRTARWACGSWGRRVVRFLCFSLSRWRWTLCSKHCLQYEKSDRM